VTKNGFIAVAIGAVLGAWSRWGLSYLFNALWPSLPPGTLIANLVGAYLIGFFIELFSLRKEIPPEAALLVNTGFMGTLTTFSTFSAEAVTLLAQGQYIWALCHITIHLVGSLILTVLGILTSRRLWA
jgi:fluoride exporter